MSDNPIADAGDRCDAFLGAIAEVCAEYRVLMQIDDMAFDECVEFVEHSDDPTGHSFGVYSSDVASAIKERFDEIHGLDPAN